jgi:Xaa-Pro aminopeptidase
MPHYDPKNIRSEDGLVLMDFGCRYHNYCSDMTRTIFMGRNGKNDEYKKIYDIVLEAQQKAIEYCREGISCSRLDAAARDFICSKGYGNNFGHGLGHGVGLEVHEGPKINAKSRTVLKENMVITIEPGIYIESLGGIRIEDMVLVGKNGCELLYDSEKEFLILD